MESQNLPTIDIELHADSNCNSLRVSECCQLATAKGIGVLSTAKVAEAKLTLNCHGPDPELGCQAKITGELIDNQGQCVGFVDTTAAELRQPTDSGL